MPHATGSGCCHRPDPGPTVCFECYRAERERRRQPVAWGTEPPRPVPSPFAEPAALSTADIGHRRAMLAHLGKICRT